MAWKYFTRAEFACKCGCGLNLIKDELVDHCDQLREAYGKPLKVNSGFRCPEHNAKVSSTGLTGPHTTGLAVDFAVDRAGAVAVLDLALMDSFFKGFGVNQKGSGRFIHLDAARDARTIWSY